MARTDFESIDQYHKAFPREVADRMQQIRKLVHSVVRSGKRRTALGEKTKK